MCITTCHLQQNTHISPSFFPSSIIILLLFSLPSFPLPLLLLWQGPASWAPANELVNLLIYVTCSASHSEQMRFLQHYIYARALDMML